MLQRISWVFLAIIVLSGCRKETAAPDAADAKLKTNILSEVRKNYLWTDHIPEDFNVQGYAGAEEILRAIRQFSIEPGFSEPVDHYSFAMKKAEWDNIASGVTTDYGFNVSFRTASELRVRSVETSSPAGKAGVRRGWQLVAIDGNQNITTSNSDFIAGKLYDSDNVAFRFRLPDGSTKDVTLTATTYQEQPLYLDTIYTEGSKKVGYLVFNSFLGRINDVRNSFVRVFSRFTQNGVTDMVVDLRYNGGGYVSLQQTLANYLVRAAANNSIMMNEEFNSQNAANNVTVKFEKVGNLNVNNIYFIVSGNTASASELLINNLKPYMNVKLVGEPTYGKPVGFFDIQVGDWLIFPVSFRSTNGMGEGNYFDGIAVDQVAGDGVDKDWGDTGEASLAAVLAHIRTGAFGYAPSPGINSRLEEDTREANRRVAGKSFKGAILR